MSGSPTLDVLSVADKAIRLKVRYENLPANNVIVAAYILTADNGIGIKKMLIEDILETDFAPADLRLTKLRNREPIEFVMDGLTNGVNYGFKLEIMYRLNSDVTAPVTIARSTDSAFGTPAGLAIAPVIQNIKAVDETSFKVTVENPIFSNPANDGGSKIVKLLIYLSRGRDDTDADHPIVNDVICYDFPTTFYAKNSNGDLEASKVFTVAGLIAGEQYEISAAFLNSIGTGVFSTSASLVNGTNKFGAIKSLEFSGSDGAGSFSFTRPDNYMISNLLGAVLENVVDPASGKVAVAALYYKFNGTGFDVLASKDDLTGSGFPFKTDALYKYALGVNNIPNNEVISYKLRLVNTFSEGVSVSTSITAAARPSPVRDAVLVEYEALQSETTWWTEFKTQKAKIDPRFSSLRSAAVRFLGSKFNWPSKGGKFRVIETVYSATSSAEDTAIKFFLSDALTAVQADAANGIAAWPAVPARSDSEKLLSEQQVRGAIQQVAGSLNNTQWTAKTDAEKLSIASNYPKLVLAIEVYYKLLAVSKDLQTLANGSNNYQEIADDNADDDATFDSKDIIKLFFIAGITPTINITARLTDPATGSILTSDPVVLTRLISAKPSGVVGQGSFEAGNNDIAFKLLEFRRDQGLDLGKGKISASLMDKGAVVSTQSKLVTFDKSVSGKILRQNYSLANDFGFILNNGSTYDVKFALADAVLDTLSQVSADPNSLTGAAISATGLGPKGKASVPNAIIRSNSDGSVSAKFTGLDGDALQGTKFTKYVTYLVAKKVASNATLKGYTQKQLASFISTNVSPGNKDLVQLDLGSNVNNAISGFIQTDAGQKAKEDYSVTDSTFVQGTFYTAITGTVTDSAISNSDYVVGDELQTFATPTDPTKVVAVPSGQNTTIQATWALPTLDGRGKPDGSNLQNFMVRLYSSSNTLSGAQIAEVSVAGSATTYSFTNAADSANSQLQIGGSYVVSVQAYSKDVSSSAKPLTTAEVLSNQVTISTPPILASAYVISNQVIVNWTANGTTADKAFYAFAVQDANGNLVDGEFIGTISVPSPSQTSITLAYTPAQTGYTLVPHGIIVLTTGQGQVTYTSTPLNAPAAPAAPAAK